MTDIQDHIKVTRFFVKKPIKELTLKDKFLDVLSECLKSDSKNTMLWKTRVVPLIIKDCQNLPEYQRFIDEHNLDAMISQIQIETLSDNQKKDLANDSKYDMRGTEFKCLSDTDQQRVRASLKMLRNMDSHRQNLIQTRLPTYCGFFDSDLLEQVPETILIEKLMTEREVLKARAEKKAALTREEIASQVNAKTTRGHVAEIYHMTPDETQAFGGGTNGGMGGTISGNQLYKIFNYLINRGDFFICFSNHIYHIA